MALSLPAVDWADVTLDGHVLEVAGGEVAYGAGAACGDCGAAGDGSGDGGA